MVALDRVCPSECVRCCELELPCCFVWFCVVCGVSGVVVGLGDDGDDGGCLLSLFGMGFLC